MNNDIDHNANDYSSECDPQDPPPVVQPSSVDPAHLLAGVGTEPAVVIGDPNNISLYVGTQAVSYPQFMSFSGHSTSNNSQISPISNTLDLSFPQHGTNPLIHAGGNSSQQQGLSQTATNLPENVPARRKSSQISPSSTAINRFSAQKLSSNRSSTTQLQLSSGPQTKSEQQRQALEKLSKAITQEIQTSSSATASVNLEELVLRALCAQQQKDKTGANALKSTTSKPKTPGVPSGTQECPYNPCQFTGRNCDLNKHIKRHLKPYGCTYPKCHKRFGAKSDWKRHENAQHFQQEAFRCDYEDPSGKRCGDHYYRDAQFQKHIKEQHQVTSVRQVQKDLKRCKIGKNCQVQYWCGFCGAIKTLSKRRNEAWDERFDHIAHHFEKDKKCIDDWICVEENRTKEQIRKATDRGAFVDDEARDLDVGRDDDTEMTVAFEEMTATSEMGPLSSSCVQNTSKKRTAQRETAESQRTTKRSKKVTILVYCVSIRTQINSILRS